jgi:hypothetical protein
MALKFLKLFGLLAAAILATYFAPKAASSIFYVCAIVAYLYDKDEPVWLTFFFVVSDGFLGFFNNFDAVVSIIPGLPEVEIGHFYVIATIVKLRKVIAPAPPIFYRHLGIAVLVYTLFLVVQGYAIGVTPELKFHFRIVKYVLPLALFLTLPRLMPRWEQYREAFGLFVPFAFLALFAQVFTVATGLAPSQALGLRQELFFTEVLGRGQTYRGFYSTGMVLISFFGALFFLTVDPASWKRPIYLGVILADILAAFLSATRGWVLAFAVILILYAVFVARLHAGRIVLGTVLGAALLFGLMRIPAIQRQFEDATDRILTIGLLAKGDVTAGGTLERLDRRAPRVMKKWRESPLTGWGFSNEYREYGDSHVGNHNVLLHGGVVGAVLMAAFLVYFAWMLVARSMALAATKPYKRGLLVFPVFLVGWFIIHSSSGQWFQFAGEPGLTIPQALFFSFGSWCYNDSFTEPV